MSRRLGILILSVVVAHLALFFFNFSKPSPPPPKKSLIVNTYIPPPTPPPPPPRPTQKPQHQKVKPVIHKHSTSQRQKVLKELGETLAKIESRQEEIKQQAPLTLPKPIETLQIDRAEQKQEEADYFVILASSLKEALELPEFGKVKLELTLLNTGKVEKVRIVHSESEKNRHYLEQQLLFLLLPPFTEELKKERKHTFVLTFCNEKS